MDTDTNDLFDTNIYNAEPQDIIQISNDNMATNTSAMSDRNISLDISNSPAAFFIPAILNKKKNKAKTSSVSPFFSQKPLIIKCSKNQIYMLIAEWIVLDTLPYSIVSSNSFATMLRYLNANINLPSCETVKSMIQSAFAIMQRDVKTLLEQIS
ncbi:25401_t:CDS:2, partial [Gigaspora margarita]